MTGIVLLSFTLGVFAGALLLKGALLLAPVCSPSPSVVKDRVLQGAAKDREGRPREQIAAGAVPWPEPPCSRQTVG